MSHLGYCNSLIGFPFCSTLIAPSLFSRQQLEWFCSNIRQTVFILLLKTLQSFPISLSVLAGPIKHYMLWFPLHLWFPTMLLCSFAPLWHAHLPVVPRTYQAGFSNGTPHRTWNTLLSHLCALLSHFFQDLTWKIPQWCLPGYPNFQHLPTVHNTCYPHAFFFFS